MSGRQIVKVKQTKKKPMTNAQIMSGFELLGNYVLQIAREHDLLTKRVKRLEKQALQAKSDARGRM
jgi:hypothetical protein